MAKACLVYCVQWKVPTQQSFQNLLLLILQFGLKFGLLACGASGFLLLKYKKVQKTTKKKQNSKKAIKKRRQKHRTEGKTIIKQKIFKRINLHLTTYRINHTFPSPVSRYLTGVGGNGGTAADAVSPTLFQSSYKYLSFEKTQPQMLMVYPDPATSSGMMH